MALAHQCSGRRLGRIASVLLAVAVPATAQQPVTSFIPASPTFDVRAWEPMAPAPGNEIDSADKLGFLNSRALLDTPRGAEAAADDVYDPAAVAPRFADALGLTLTTQNAPATLGLIARLVKDAEVLVAPIKAMRPPAGTGRVRPFVAYPNTPHCPLTAGDTAADLPDTGSYPSTHAMLGWIWASVLIAGAPDRAINCWHAASRWRQPRRLRVPLFLGCDRWTARRRGANGAGRSRTRLSAGADRIAQRDQAPSDQPAMTSRRASGSHPTTDLAATVRGVAKTLGASV